MEDPLLHKQIKTPEERAGFWSKLTYSYVTPILVTGFQEPLQAHHLPPINKRYEARRVRETWEESWQLEKRKTRPSLVRALIRCFVWRFQISVVMEVIELIFSFFGPILMQNMIIYTQSVNRDVSEGMFYVTIMFTTSLFRAISATQVGQVLAGLGLDMQTVMVTSIYNKAIKASTTSTYTKGEIINIMSNDAIRVANTAMSLNAVWTTPANLIIAIILLLRTMGISSMVGMIVMLTLFPFNTLIFWALASLRIELLTLTDKRVTLMSEMLAGIRVVKFTCLEEHFKNRVLDVRRRELLLIKKQAYWHAMAAIILFCIPIMVSVSTFVTYSALGNTLNAAIIFTASALFSNLRGPLGMIPALLSAFAEARTSLQRLTKYLLQPEILPDKDPDDPYYGDAVV